MRNILKLSFFATILALVSITHATNKNVKPLTPLDLQKGTLLEKSFQLHKVLEKYSELDAPTSDNKSKVYALLDIFTHEGLLDIEHICIQNFDLLYCGDAMTALSRQWAVFNRAMKNDQKVVELMIEVTLGSMHDNKLSLLLVKTGLLQKVFTTMSENKEAVWNGFNKGQH